MDDANTLALRGTNQDRPSARRVQAGGISALFEPDTGFLRQVRKDGVLLLNAIYVAVRRNDWSTCLPKIEVTREAIDTDHFQIEFTATHEDERTGFRWKGSVVGTKEGEIRYEMDGEATKAFDTCRTGVCVLHPASDQGAKARALHGKDPEEAGAFPGPISPHQPFTDLTGILVESPLGTVRLEFEGEIFEMEDQRNWGDASFKTYCRPLRWKMPYPLAVGDRVKHQVRFRLEDFRPTSSVAPRGTIEARLAPRIFLRNGTSGQPSWVEADLNADALPDVPDGALLAVRWRGSTEEALAKLGAHLGQRKVTMLLPWPHEAATVALARRHLPASVRLAAGGMSNFTDLNRNRLSTHRLDAIAWGFQPQVHAFDERSILETPPMVVDQAASAEAFVAGVGKILAPVRFSGGDDPRVGSLFAGVWVAGMLEAALLAGLEGIAFADAFETGTPAWHVLKDFLDLPDAVCAPLVSPGLYGWRAQLGRRERWVVANALDEPVEWKVPGEGFTVRVLDASAFASARSAPQAFRASGSSSGASLRLDSYGIATLDFED